MRCPFVFHLQLLLVAAAPAEGLRVSPVTNTTEQPIVTPLRNWTAEPAVEDDGALHVAVVGCNAGCVRLDHLLRTLLAQARLDGSKVVAHFFVDRRCWHVLKFVASTKSEMGGSVDIQADNVTSIKDGGSVDIRAGNVTSIKDGGSVDIGAYNVTNITDGGSVDIRAYNVFSVEGVYAGNTTHGHKCTMVRLYLPRLFPKVNRLLYLDTDTLVAGSLKPVYYGLHVPVLALAENDRTFYHDDNRHCPRWKGGQMVLMPDQHKGQSCYFGKHGVNAGVILFNLTGWRNTQVDLEIDRWVEQYLSGEVDLWLSDQDILNLVILNHTDYFAPLPCEMNSLLTHRWMCYYGGGTWEAEEERLLRAVYRRNNRMPVVLHSKCGFGTYSQTWRFLRDELLRFADLVNLRGLRNGSSLCATFDCDQLLDEAPYSCPCVPERKEIPCNCTAKGYYVRATWPNHTNH